MCDRKERQSIDMTSLQETRFPEVTTREDVTAREGVCFRGKTGHVKSNNVLVGKAGLSMDTTTLQEVLPSDSAGTWTDNNSRKGMEWQ